MGKKFKTVVFICTGNYYRSRFSECLFNALAKKRGLRWRATSRGLQAWIVDGEGPISEFTAYRLTAMGIPFDGEQFPAQLSAADLENADLVVALKKAEHYDMILDQFPAWADQIDYWAVDDLDCATPDESLPVCEECVETLVERLLAEQAREAAPAGLRRAG